MIHDSNKQADGNPETSHKLGARIAQLPSFRKKMPQAVSTLSQTLKILPKRYNIKNAGKESYLTCVESPNIRVFVDRQFCVTNAAAKKYPEGSIFLDGAAKGEPFLDVQKKIYNMDHHEGCVRAFTLSTCEQAFILIMKGLDLGVGDWCVYANEPDLDTVLAIWLILNHMRVRAEDPEIRKELLPLLRLQGIIDSHGFEMTEFTGFPDDLQETTLQQIKKLRESELELKSEGKWATVNELEYVSSILRSLDESVYSSRHFDGVGQVEELFRIKIGSDKIAVACSSEFGIYETEEMLKKTHGSRLGLIFLKKSEDTYTIRQVDPFLPTNLNRLYDRLNILDPNTSSSANWAGSEEIGGSPRGVGTGLDIQKIKQACQWVYNKQSFLERARGTFWSTSLAFVILGSAFTISHLLYPTLSGWQIEATTHVKGLLSFNLTVLALSLFYMILDRNYTFKFFGLGPVRGNWWLLFLPLTVGASVLNGMIPRYPFQIEGAALITGLLVTAPFAWEFLFRGVVHGMLVKSHYTMCHGGRWFLSGPTVISSLLAVLAMGLLFQCNPLISSLIPIPKVICLLGVFTSGLAYGVVRERTQSVISCSLLHTFSVLIVAFGSQFIA
ncbi:MAG: hypothetical protein CSA81_05785 [Acidobacteria bacterium]|nr:MAG: hypothetical protein CSA81_05785 [Acidobacteriota bacterium]